MKIITTDDVRQGKDSVSLEELHTTYCVNGPHSPRAVLWSEYLEAQHRTALWANTLFSVVPLGGAFDFCGARVTCLRKVFGGHGVGPELDCAYLDGRGTIVKMSLDYGDIHGIKSI